MISLEQIMVDARLIVKKHNWSWNNRFDEDTLESELMYWVATHYISLMEIHNKNGQNQYFGYFTKCATTLLNRFCLNERVYQIENMESIDSTEWAPNGDKVVGREFTRVNVETMLKAGNKRFIELAKSICTEIQFKAIEAVLIEGKTVKQYSLLQGVKAQTVHSNIERGISNIVVRGFDREMAQ